MKQTITRKYISFHLPDLSHVAPQHNERHYLYIGESSVIRIESKDDRYELEKKTDISKTVREEEVIPLAKEEFEQLAKYTSFHIVRDSYIVSDNPKTILRIYKGRFEGLNRCEVFFNTNEDALKYQPPKWFGTEITNTPLGKDMTLLKLSDEEFNELLGH